MSIDLCVEKIIELCKENQLKIATAESFTAGLIASTIADIPGASDILFGGAVTYMVEAKNLFLDIPMDFINKYGVVSKQVCNKMAYNISRLCNTDFGIGSTGYAGPGKDAGHVFVSIYYDNKFYTKEMYLKMSRNKVRRIASNAVLLKLFKIIKEVK